MEKKKLPQIVSASPAAPPPSPIPTGKGSRSAADQILSEYIDKSIQIPELTLPPQVHQFKPVEINYESLQLREKDSVRGLVRSGRELGVFKIIDHGILTEDLRFALGDSERIFGLTVECCTRYGDHERLVWRGDDHQIMQEAAAMIGEEKLQILRQKVENVARQLEGIAKELGKVIAQSVGEHEFLQLGESTLSMYRYHRANIIDRTSSVIGETSQISDDPYAFTLHLLLEPSELCLQNLSFHTTPHTIVVTMGKELQEWSVGELKSAQGKLMLKPFLHTNRPSFSIEQKWSAWKPRNGVGEWNKGLTNAVGEAQSNKIISLSDQILILLLVAFLYKSLVYILS
ncbi:hypothetical protein Salat_2298200 [Sesamum alatum]|uniref:Uncharacterized protein n=1 Tax=Sesamum alatum TaxID=300844 RepID=A0AAE1XVN8_9LAMI|nr:hypothetical protein Salat_2298200 [Sesamum alatum]